MAWRAGSSILHHSAAEFKRLGNSEAAGADGPLALNQQTERHPRNIHGNATIPPGIHGHPGEAPCDVRSNSVQMNDA